MGLLVTTLDLLLSWHHATGCPPTSALYLRCLPVAAGTVPHMYRILPAP